MDRRWFSQVVRQVLATKSRPEVEDDEAQRLVRPMPKAKPPRRDRRREHMELDRDPDVEGDPDLKGDPDLSLNYKNIGGSVARRFIAENERIPAKSRETGKVVLIAPDTLKKEPGKYQEVEPEEAQPSAAPGKAKPKKDKPAKEPAPEPEQGSAAANLLERVRGDESLLTRLRSLAHPEQLGGMAKQNPDLKLEALKGPGEEVAKATGATTLGEAFKVLEESGGIKAIEKAFKAKPKAKPVEKPTEAPKPTEAAPPTALEPTETPEKAPEPQTAPATPEGPSEPKKSPAGTPKKAPAKKTAPSGPPPEPTEAEKAGIPAPKRAEATEQDYEEVVGLILDTFPTSVASQIMERNLHPDDVRELVSAYAQARQMPKPKDLSAFAQEAQGFFELNPDRVAPPKKWKTADGSVVDFATLPESEKAEAYRKHQMQVVALSQATQETLSKEFELRSGLGAPRVPPYVASAISTALLTKQSPEETARSLFQAAVEKGEVAKLAPGSVKKLMAAVPPEVQPAVRGFLQANDYNEAKSLFLDSGEISERDRAGVIFKNLKKADTFLIERAATYGDDTKGAAKIFRNKVLSQLRTLDPDKYKQVRTLFDHEEANQYEAAVKAHKKAMSAWKDRMMAWGKKQGPYRGEPFAEEPPEPPKPPPRYALVRPSKTEAAGLLDEVRSRTKTASRVTEKFISFYSSSDAMDRKAVYHGIDPVQSYPGRYPKGTQPHQRDFGEADSMVVLAAAREWLKQPVLSKAVPGFERETQMRAALDLGLQSSGYAGHVSPGLYDQLLAQLTGAGSPNKEGSTTQLQGKPCKPYTSDTSLGNPSATKEPPMPTKLSAETKKAADETLGLLDKVAATIEANYQNWGMNFEDAKRIVNQLDVVADSVESNVYGPASLQRRQIEVLKTAQVLQKDSDEPYMDTFNKPTAVHQQDADEAYMSAYQDDQTAAVRGGRDAAGKPLAGN